MLSTTLDAPRIQPLLFTISNKLLTFADKLCTPDVFVKMFKGRLYSKQSGRKYLSRLCGSLGSDFLGSEGGVHILKAIINFADYTLCQLAFGDFLENPRCFADVWRKALGALLAIDNVENDNRFK